MAFEEKTPLMQQQQPVGQTQPPQPQQQPQQQQQFIQQPYQQQFYYPQQPQQQQQYVVQPIIYQSGDQQFIAAQAPPPGYVYQAVPAYQAPSPIVVEKKHCESHSQSSNRDTTGALIIFVLGFFVSCIWLAGCMYFRSPNKLARGLGILSVVFFCIGVIVAIIVLSIVLASTTPYQDFGSSSSYYPY